MEPWTHLEFLLLGVLLVLSGTVAAQDDTTAPAEPEERPKSKEADPFFRQRGIDDRAAVSVGGMFASATTNARVDSDAGFGSTLLLEELLNLPRDRTYPRIHGYYRFSRRHRIDLRWYPTRVFGFGVALNRTRIDVEIERPGGDVKLDYLLEGPSVFVTFAIPGLK